MTAGGREEGRRQHLPSLSEGSVVLSLFIGMVPFTQPTFVTAPLHTPPAANTAHAPTPPRAPLPVGQPLSMALATADQAVWWFMCWLDWF